MNNALLKDNLAARAVDSQTRKVFSRSGLIAGLCLSSLVSSYAIPGGVDATKAKNESVMITQQAKRVSGVVTDSAGEPIPGANVVQKETTNGTVTDMNGKYTLDVPNNATLVISFIGYTTKEIKVGSQSVLNVSLVEEAIGLNEVIAIGYGYVKKGLVAVAVDNPSCGELSDNGYFDYLNTSRILLEVGWSYLGLTAWQDWNILNWMKAQSYIDKERVIISGFSLGTEPLMVLGVLDPSIYAFVYNDFLCRTLERILVMTKPDEKGRRPFPNSIEHLIPGFLTQFDFPDLVAALAPRPVICTEGGLDRDFELIKEAYQIVGKPDNFTFYHYKKFANPKDRQQIDRVPEGIDLDTFFQVVNVDPKNHYFKAELVLPWIDKVLK